MTDSRKTEILHAAHGIAGALDECGYQGHEGIMVFGITIGMFLECQDGSHREFQDLFDTMFDVAQGTFDKLREYRERMPS